MGWPVGTLGAEGHKGTSSAAITRQPEQSQRLGTVGSTQKGKQGIAGQGKAQDPKGPGSGHWIFCFLCHIEVAMEVTVLTQRIETLSQDR